MRSASGCSASAGWGRCTRRRTVASRCHFPECDGRARLVVAADEVEERARAAADKLGYERSTTDWREVIADPEVEAVSICTPNFMHREMAIAAAEAGKHFWGEKPLGALPEDTLEIERVATAAGVRTMVGLNYRNPPAVQYARSLIQEGDLGDVNHFRMQFIASYSVESPRRALVAVLARAFRSRHPLRPRLHAIDLAQYLCGPIVRATATASILIPERPKVEMGTGTHFSVVEGDVELGPVENEDWCAALVEFASGLKGTIELSRVVVGADARYWFEINGTRGAVAWNFERMNELEVNGARILMGPQHPDFARFQPGQGIPMGYDDLKVIEAYRFLQSIADGEQREPGVREMAATARVLDAVARSFASGAWEEV